jgi:hypothetical protein
LLRKGSGCGRCRRVLAALGRLLKVPFPLLSCSIASPRSASPPPSPGERSPTSAASFRSPPSSAASHAPSPPSYPPSYSIQPPHPHSRPDSSPLVIALPLTPLALALVLPHSELPAYLFDSSSPPSPSPAPPAPSMLATSCRWLPPQPATATAITGRRARWGPSCPATPHLLLAQDCCNSLADAAGHHSSSAE